MKAKLWNIISLLLAGLMSYGVMSFFSGCDPKANGDWMPCHTAQIAICALGVVSAVAFLLAVFMKTKPKAVLFEFIGAVFAVAAVAIQGNVFELCAANSMRCCSVMRPFVIVMCVLICISAIVSIVFTIAARKGVAYNSSAYMVEDADVPERIRTGQQEAQDQEAVGPAADAKSGPEVEEVDKYERS